MTTNDKVKALRKQMKDAELDFYIINTADPHQSEYLSDHFKERAWISGFTGSQGTALVSMDEALVWADGRYFIQAEKEIEGSEFKLMKMATPGYPSLQEWLVKNVPEGAVVGVNEASYSQSNFEGLEKALAANKANVKAVASLIDGIWEDRPALPSAKIFAHELEFTGQEAKEKIEKVREQLREDKAQATIIVGLDDIAWLYNFRGGDIANNPVALAYAVITLDKAYLFIDENKVSADMRDFFAGQDITILPYEEVSQVIAQLDVERLVCQKNRINTQLYKAIPEKVKVIDKRSYVQMNKASMNEVEQKNQKHAYIKDSAALTRFLFWLRREVQKGTKLNEWQAAERLQEFRSKGEHYIEDSFTAISAYGPNAAMMHYAPSPNDSAQIEPKSFYLIDSGGQYLDGTTDITRTIAVGPLTDEEKTDFTLTLKGHINLAMAVFLEGTTGHYLDVLSRQPLWKHFSDYKCGTGHAVGYVLGVHEGPQNFSRNYIPIALKEGMHVTVEPGVYKEGKHGIRLENDFVVVLAGENPPDRFFKFEVMSFVPLDREAIKTEMLNEEELEWLNNYHSQVLEKLSPYMETEEEKADLQEACAPLKR